MINKIILIGRVGQKPELRTTQSGSKVTSFSIATTENYSDKKTNEKKENTAWHRIVVWNNTAEIVTKYVNKGDLIYIEGKITYNSYEDKKTGAKVYSTEILANTVKFLNNTKNKSQNNDLKVQEVIQNIESSFTEDEIPF